MKHTMKVAALALVLSSLTACASVGVRTIGKQPVTVIIGYVPAPTPAPTTTPKDNK